MTGGEDLLRVRYGTQTGRRKPARRVPFAVLLVAIVLGGLVVLLALNTVSAANELRANQLTTRDDAVTQDVQQLQIDVANDAAPDHLAAAAEALGMVPADAPAFIVLGPHGGTRLMGHPEAARGGALPVPLAPGYKAARAAKSGTGTTTATKKTVTKKPATKNPATTKTAGTKMATRRTAAKKTTTKKTATKKTTTKRPTHRRAPAKHGGHR